METSLKRFGQQLKKATWKDYLTFFLTAALLFLISAMFLMRSPVNPFVNADVPIDSSVFKTVALCMQNGLMPYRDTFDHKGPLLYVINYLGNQISYYKGIWVIELLFFFITNTFLYKTARLFCNRVLAFLTVLLSSVGMFHYYESGNYTEEYALCFIAISLFVFSDYFLHQKINAFRLIVCGACFGAVLMLQPNLSAVWCVFCIAVLIHSIAAKETDSLLYFVEYFLLGTMAVVVPFVIFMAAKGVLSDFWYAYITFNSKYISLDNNGSRMALKDFAKSFAFFAFNPIVILALAASLVTIRKKNLCYHVAIVVYLVLTFVLTAVSGRMSEQYGMIFIPAIVAPMASFAGWLEEKKKPFGIILTILFGLVSICVCAPKWFTLSKDIIQEIRHPEELKEPASAAISALILSESEEDDLITVYGNWNIIYVRTKRLPASKYSFQFPIGDVCPEIMDEYYEDLYKNVPAWVVLQGDLTDRMANFLNENGYHLRVEDNENGMLVFSR